MDYTLNVGGHLLSLDRTKVMGILNVTPDSFYASSRSVTSDAVKSRVEELLAEGADIIDIGACSTRPSAS
ncbi:MAG: dihydropteroate synthase, partial [Lachnospiraceae bacterium]|nr:dihydropteroate synthase [Lachnospiraceae bacterium]